MHGRWDTLVVQGKTVDCYDPPAPERPRFGLLFLHDRNEQTLGSPPALAELFDSLNLACACPHGGQAWWTDRVCAGFDEKNSPEFHIRSSVLPALRQRWGMSEGAFGVLGFGMGGAGALRLAFKQPAQFPAVAGIAAALDYHELYGQGTALDEMYDSQEQCRQDTALLHVHPSKYPPHIFFCIDPEDHFWFRGNDRLHEKLSALGIAHEFDFVTQAGSHSWAYFERQAERAVRFLHAGLEQESRRLI
jgi:S-formylglutathione hydrolase